jgi:hypothetical protein
MLPLTKYRIGCPEPTTDRSSPYFTAVCIAHASNGEPYAIDSKLVSWNKLKEFEDSGACVVQRHFKCPRLIYVIMN